MSEMIWENYSFYPNQYKTIKNSNKNEENSRQFLTISTFMFKQTAVIFIAQVSEQTKLTLRVFKNSFFQEFTKDQTEK